MMEDLRAPLSVDYRELATYVHNQRCYVWEWVLGLTHSDGISSSNGAILRRLNAYYEGGPFTATGLKQDLLNAKLNLKTIATIKYVERSLGTFKYGGLIQRVGIDKSDHAWVIEPTFNDAIPDSYVQGLYWLGQHHVANLIRSGDAPERTRFGGVIVHYLEGDTSWNEVRFSSYQTMVWLQNAYKLTAEIADKRQDAHTAIMNGDPMMQTWKTVFPHWQCECPWHAVNSAADAELEAKLLADCSSATPAWEARKTL